MKSIYKKYWKTKTNWKTKKWLSTSPFFEGKKNWKMRVFIRNIGKLKQKDWKTNPKGPWPKFLAQSLVNT